MDRNALRVRAKNAFHVGNYEGAAPLAVCPSAMEEESKAGYQRPRLCPCALRRD